MNLSKSRIGDSSNAGYDEWNREYQKDALVNSLSISHASNLSTSHSPTKRAASNRPPPKGRSPMKQSPRPTLGRTDSNRNTRLGSNQPMSGHNNNKLFSNDPKQFGIALDKENNTFASPTFGYGNKQQTPVAQKSVISTPNSVGISMRQDVVDSFLKGAAKHNYELTAKVDRHNTQKALDTIAESPFMSTLYKNVDNPSPIIADGASMTFSPAFMNDVSPVHKQNETFNFQHTGAMDRRSNPTNLMDELSANARPIESKVLTNSHVPQVHETKGSVSRQADKETYTNTATNMQSQQKNAVSKETPRNSSFNYQKPTFASGSKSALKSSSPSRRSAKKAMNVSIQEDNNVISESFLRGDDNNNTNTVFQDVSSAHPVNNQSVSGFDLLGQSSFNVIDVRTKNQSFTQKLSTIQESMDSSMHESQHMSQMRNKSGVYNEHRVFEEPERQNAFGTSNHFVNSKVNNSNAVSDDYLRDAVPIKRSHAFANPTPQEKSSSRQFRDEVTYDRNRTSDDVIVGHQYDFDEPCQTTRNVEHSNHKQLQQQSSQQFVDVNESTRRGTHSSSILGGTSLIADMEVPRGQSSARPSQTSQSYHVNVMDEVQPPRAVSRERRPSITSNNHEDLENRVPVNNPQVQGNGNVRRMSEDFEVNESVWQDSKQFNKQSYHLSYGNNDGVVKQSAPIQQQAPRMQQQQQREAFVERSYYESNGNVTVNETVTHENNHFAYSEGAKYNSVQNNVSMKGVAEVPRASQLYMRTDSQSAVNNAPPVVESFAPTNRSQSATRYIPSTQSRPSDMSYQQKDVNRAVSVDSRVSSDRAHGTNELHMSYVNNPQTRRVDMSYEQEEHNFASTYVPPVSMEQGIASAPYRFVRGNMQMQSDVIPVDSHVHETAFQEAYDRPQPQEETRIDPATYVPNSQQPISIRSLYNIPSLPSPEVDREPRVTHIAPPMQSVYVARFGGVANSAAVSVPTVGANNVAAPISQYQFKALQQYQSRMQSNVPVQPMQQQMQLQSQFQSQFHNYQTYQNQVQINEHAENVVVDKKPQAKVQTSGQEQREFTWLDLPFDKFSADETAQFHKLQNDYYIGLVPHEEYIRRIKAMAGIVDEIPSDENEAVELGTSEISISMMTVDDGMLVNSAYMAHEISALTGSFNTPSKLTVSPIPAIGGYSADKSRCEHRDADDDFTPFLASKTKPTSLVLPDDVDDRHYENLKCNEVSPIKPVDTKREVTSSLYGSRNKASSPKKSPVRTVAFADTEASAPSGSRQCSPRSKKSTTSSIGLGTAGQSKALSPIHANNANQTRDDNNVDSKLFKNLSKAFNENEAIPKVESTIPKVQPISVAGSEVVEASEPVLTPKRSREKAKTTSDACIQSETPIRVIQAAQRKIEVVRPVAVEEKGSVDMDTSMTGFPVNCDVEADLEDSEALKDIVERINKHNSTLENRKKEQQTAMTPQKPAEIVDQRPIFDRTPFMGQNYKKYRHMFQTRDEDNAKLNETSVLTDDISMNVLHEIDPMKATNFTGDSKFYDYSRYSDSDDEVFAAAHFDKVSDFPQREHVTKQVCSDHHNESEYSPVFQGLAGRPVDPHVQDVDMSDIMTTATTISTSSHIRPNPMSSEWDEPKLYLTRRTRPRRSPSDKVKEIVIETPPGTYASIPLVFSNRKQRLVAMYPRAITVRLDPLNPRDQAAVQAADLSSVFMVSPHKVRMMANDDGTMHVTFNPIPGIRGYYTGVLKIKMEKKSLVVLLRGEALDGNNANGNVNVDVNQEHHRQVPSNEQPRQVSNSQNDVICDISAETNENNKTFGFSELIAKRQLVIEKLNRCKELSPKPDNDDSVSLTSSRVEEMLNSGLTVDQSTSESSVTGVIVVSPETVVLSPRPMMDANQTLWVDGEMTVENPSDDHIKVFLTSSHCDIKLTKNKVVLRGKESSRIRIFSTFTSNSSIDLGLKSLTLGYISISSSNGDQYIVDVIVDIDSMKASLMRHASHSTANNVVPVISTTVQSMQSNASDNKQTALEVVREVSNKKMESTITAATTTTTTMKATETTVAEAIVEKSRHPLGLFFRRDEVNAGVVPIGSLTRIKVELCNSTDEEVVVLLGDPKLPFILLHNDIKLRPRSYVRIPIQFVPVVASEFCNELIAHTSDGKFSAKIQLRGSSY